jgi:hypothetical protein
VRAVQRPTAVLCGASASFGMESGQPCEAKGAPPPHAGSMSAHPSHVGCERPALPLRAAACRRCPPLWLFGALYCLTPRAVPAAVTARTLHSSAALRVLHVPPRHRRIASNTLHGSFAVHRHALSPSLLGQQRQSATGTPCGSGPDHPPAWLVLCQPFALVAAVDAQRASLLPKRGVDVLALCPVLNLAWGRPDGNAALRSPPSGGTPAMLVRMVLSLTPRGVGCTLFASCLLSRLGGGRPCCVQPHLMCAASAMHPPVSASVVGGLRCAHPLVRML